MGAMNVSRTGVWDEMHINNSCENGVEVCRQ